MCGTSVESPTAEVVDAEVDVFDRGGAFIERVLTGPLRLAATITS